MTQLGESNVAKAANVAHITTLVEIAPLMTGSRGKVLLTIERMRLSQLTTKQLQLLCTY